MADQIRYDLLTQKALLGVVRSVLGDVAKKGLPGDHHFYIGFDTQAPGVRLSERLRAQYPEQMTIILQHQYWDLNVNDHAFEVGLSFGGLTEKLTIPFDAIHSFYDPSVEFGLQFEDVTESQDRGAALADAADKPGKEKAKKKPPGAAKPVAIAPAAAAPDAKPATKPDDPQPTPPTGGGEVVRLDRFRKK